MTGPETNTKADEAPPSPEEEENLIDALRAAPPVTQDQMNLLRRIVEHHRRELEQPNVQNRFQHLQRLDRVVTLLKRFEANAKLAALRKSAQETVTRARQMTEKVDMGGTETQEKAAKTGAERRRMENSFLGNIIEALHDDRGRFNWKPVAVAGVAVAALGTLAYLLFRKAGSAAKWIATTIAVGAGILGSGAVLAQTGADIAQKRDQASREATQNRVEKLAEEAKKRLEKWQRDKKNRPSAQPSESIPLLEDPSLLHRDIIGRSFRVGSRTLTIHRGQVIDGYQMLDLQVDRRYFGIIRGYEDSNGVHVNTIARMIGGFRNVYRREGSVEFVTGNGNQTIRDEDLRALVERLATDSPARLERDGVEMWGYRVLLYTSELPSLGEQFPEGESGQPPLSPEQRRKKRGELSRQAREQARKKVAQVQREQPSGWRDRIAPILIPIRDRWIAIRDGAARRWVAVRDWTGDRWTDVRDGTVTASRATRDGVVTAARWTRDRAVDAGRAVGTAARWTGDRAVRIGRGVGRGARNAWRWVRSWF